jgi:DNA (cytosine-5)-methyltransferase 1
MSLFDGSAAFPLAASKYGIDAVYMSEVEPFPIAVSKSQFPNAKHLGDVSKVNGGELEPVDIVTFGSPCQDLSIAGKKQGLEGGQRSSLFFQAVRIIKEMLDNTNGEYPRYIIWENVPNATSINEGEDFKLVMNEFNKIGFTCDPNILDASKFGVAQRRLRIFIVGINEKYYNYSDFFIGKGSRAERMQKALKKWKGMTFAGITSRWYDENTQKLSDVLEKGVDEKYYLTPRACEGLLRRLDENNKIIPDILRQSLEKQMQGLFGEGGETEEEGKYSIDDQGGAFINISEEKVGTLRAEANGHAPITVVKKEQDAVSFGICGKSANSMKSDNPYSGVYETDTAKTLDTSQQHISNQGGLVVCEPQTFIMPGGNFTSVMAENLAPTLIAGCNKATPIVTETYAIARQSEAKVDVDIAPCLTSRDNTGAPIVTEQYSMTTGSFAQVNKDIAPCLAARDYKDPPIVNEPIGESYGLDRRSISGGQQGGFAPVIQAECSPSLVAVGCNGCAQPPLYRVRRLTPIECLKLMGLPKDWCDKVAVINPTEEDFEFWDNVFKTYAEINPEAKPKTRKQIESWLKDPYSDSACYKMAGNGVVVPLVEWLFEGIVEHAVDKGLVG